MLQLILFDLSRALRPGAGTLVRGHVYGLGRVPASMQADLGLGGGLLLTRALQRAAAQMAERDRCDADRLLAILCALAAARGFGPLEWESEDA